MDAVVAIESIDDGNHEEQHNVTPVIGVAYRVLQHQLVAFVCTIASYDKNSSFPEVRELIILCLPVNMAHVARPCGTIWVSAM